jgi:hypothetical protein
MAFLRIVYITDFHGFEYRCGRRPLRLLATIPHYGSEKNGLKTRPSSARLCRTQSSHPSSRWGASSEPEEVHVEESQALISQ